MNLTELLAGDKVKEEVIVNETPILQKIGNITSNYLKLVLSIII